MGVLTRVHPRSGLIGLLAGVLYGFVRMLSPMIADSFGIAVLPSILANSWAAYPFSMFVSAATMVIVSLFTGFTSRATQLGENHKEDSPWLRESLETVQNLDHVHESEGEDRSTRLPIALAATAVIAGCVLSFVILW